MLLLRVHRIPRPVTVRVRDEYLGCRSWVEIDRDLPFEGTPVMADEEFDRAAAAIREIVHGLARPGLSGLGAGPGGRAASRVAGQQTGKLLIRSWRMAR